MTLAGLRRERRPADDLDAGEGDGLLCWAWNTVAHNTHIVSSLS